MTLGKCYLYKRATLYREGQPPYILDYSDGIEPENCEVDVSGEFPTYKWNLPSRTIDIQLNVPRTKVESILHSGEIPFEEGVLRYEYILGKYRSFAQYYGEKAFNVLPLLLIIVYLLR